MVELLADQKAQKVREELRYVEEAVSVYLRLSHALPGRFVKLLVTCLCASIAQN